MPARASDQGIDHWISLGAIICSSITGSLFYLGLPVITGALAEGRSIGNAQLGALASVAMGAMFGASILTTMLIARVNVRIMLVVALLVLIGGDCGIVWADKSLSLLALSVAIVGLGGGTCYSVSLGMLAGSRHPVRVFSTLLFCQVLVTGLELAALPMVARVWGVTGVFAILAAVAALTLCLAPFVPDSQLQSRPGRPRSLGARALVPGGLTLSAVMFFYVAIGALWTFEERLGVFLKLNSTVVASALSAGNMLSLLSTTVAVAFVSRIGLTRALLQSLAILAISLAGLAAVLTIPMYLAGMAVFFFSWNLIDIFQASTICNLDTHGRLAALIPAAQCLGNTIGPGVAGLILGNGERYGAVLVGASLCVAAAMVAHVAAMGVLKRCSVTKTSTG